MHKSKIISIDAIDLLIKRLRKIIEPILSSYLGTSSTHWATAANQAIDSRENTPNEFTPDELLKDPAFILKVCIRYWVKLTENNQELNNKKVIINIRRVLSHRNEISHNSDYSNINQTIELIDHCQKILNTFEKKYEQDKALKKWRDELCDTNQPNKTTFNNNVWKLLDKKQQKLITSSSKSGYRRVKGSAGSGKTIVAAARAVEVAKEGKSVLIVVYNKTMATRMRVIVEGCSQIANRREALSNIQIFSIYALFKKIVEWADMHELLPSYNPDVPFETYGKHLFEAANEAVKNEIGKRIPYFDCIVVDEGQDFTFTWWQFLRTLKIPSDDANGDAHGEMLLIADATQDLYGKARAWTEETMKGAGFTGAWFSLDQSYRMPVNFIPLAKDFVQNYLPINQYTNSPEIGSQDNADDDNLLKFTFELEWVNADRDPIDELYNAVKKHYSLSDTRKAVIQASKDNCTNIINILNQTEYKTKLRHALNSYGPNAKDSFSIEDGQIGVITPHGFKGYEAPIVFVLIDNFSFVRAKYAVYTAITRVLKHDTGSKLIIVNTTSELRHLGKRWNALLNGENPKASEGLEIPGDIW